MTIAAPAAAASAVAVGLAAAVVPAPAVRVASPNGAVEIDLYLVNGPAARTLRIDLGFPGKGRYDAPGR